MVDFKAKTCGKRKLFEVEINDLWDEFDAVIKDIFDKRLSQPSYLALERFAHSHCTREKKKENGEIDFSTLNGGELYERIEKNLNCHLRNLALESHCFIPCDKILQFYSKHWENYKYSIGVIHNMCDYLNRNYVKRERDQGNSSKLEIDQLALRSWIHQLMLGKINPINTRVVRELLKMIERERNGEIVDTKLMASVVRSYVSLGVQNDVTFDSVYKVMFENSFIDETRKFYSRESDDIFNRYSISEYLVKVEKRINEEETRVENCLHEDTLIPIREICNELYIEKRWTNLLQEFDYFLENDSHEDIIRMCKLVSRIPNKIDRFYDVFEAHIRERGLKSIGKCGNEALNNPKLFFDIVLQVCKRFLFVKTKVLQNNVGFAKSFDKACERFINYNYVTRAKNSSSAKIPELIAKYCDSLLKKTSSDVDFGVLEETLNDVIIVFKFIEDKDIFQKFYSQMLAKRLLHHTSINMDVEESFINKFKEVCGLDFTLKLTGMLKDVALNHTLKDDFRKCGGQLDVDFSVQVLSSGLWPLKKLSDLVLPLEFTKCVERFTEFYNTKFSGRKLNWLLPFSKGELIANCFKNRYMFQVSTYQMLVLLQFNSGDHFSFQLLEEVTQIKREYLNQVIQILLKSKLLVCDDDENDLKSTSVIRLFVDYKNKKQRINLNVPLKLETKTEQDETQKFVEQERNIVIQAAIVRLMKREKELQHQQLLAKVLNDLSSLFKPKVISVKKCIDLLVEKEYLERIRDEKDIYRYMA